MGRDANYCKKEPMRNYMCSILFTDKKINEFDEYKARHRVFKAKLDEWVDTEFKWDIEELDEHKIIFMPYRRKP